MDAETAFAFAKALGPGITAKTRNAYVGDLSTAWRLFMRHGKAAANPWPLAKIPRNRDEETTGRAFTPDEISRLMIAATNVGRDWPTVLMIGLYTGTNSRSTASATPSFRGWRRRGSRRTCGCALRGIPLW